MKTPIWESSPGALVERMRTKRAVEMANLYTLTLADGTVARWTDWASDLVVDGDFFKAPGCGYAPAPFIFKLALRYSTGAVFKIVNPWTPGEPPSDAMSGVQGQLFAACSKKITGLDIVVERAGTTDAGVAVPKVSNAVTFIKAAGASQTIPLYASGAAGTYGSETITSGLIGGTSYRAWRQSGYLDFAGVDTSAWVKAAPPDLAGSLVAGDTDLYWLLLDSTCYGVTLWSSTQSAQTLLGAITPRGV